MKHTRQAEAALVTALAAGRSLRDAAEAAGISERTARRRLNDPEVRRAVEAARSELVSRAVGDLAEGAWEASHVLRGLLRSESEAIRLGAARTILASVVVVREHSDLAEQVAELEALVESSGADGLRAV